MTDIDDLSPAAQDFIHEHEHKNFADFMTRCEDFLGRGIPLTLKQVVILETHWRGVNPNKDARKYFEESKQIRFREKGSVARRYRIPVKQVVTRNGHKVTIYRDVRTGRFVRSSTRWRVKVYKSA
ncbi:MAG: hypothetical protein JRN15_13985 [Nitrososphaerota archaeon]|nr:hypothetical protein [Nitrososphaerota archaeon]